MVLSEHTFLLWSLGATLHHLFTGETLVSSNDVGNIDKEQLLLLHDWSDEPKHEKLSKIMHPGARNLVSRLLSKDPANRISLLKDWAM